MLTPHPGGPRGNAPPSLAYHLWPGANQNVKTSCGEATGIKLPTRIRLITRLCQTGWSSPSVCGRHRSAIVELFNEFGYGSSRQTRRGWGSIEKLGSTPCKPDPVPNELIRKILEAGVCASSGGNMQRWRFLVIKDAAIKQTVGAYYKRAWDEQVAQRYRSGEPAPGMSRERFLRLLDAAEYLAAHIHEAPAWIVPCLEGGAPTRTSGSSIYPAVQNMLLTARALGLGATLTTLYLQYEKEAEAALGLPPNVHSYALLPIGYPMGRFGPVRRVPLADVVYEDRWASLAGICSGSK